MSYCFSKTTKYTSKPNIGFCILINKHNTWIGQFIIWPLFYHRKVQCNMLPVNWNYSNNSTFVALYVSVNLYPFITNSLSLTNFIFSPYIHIEIKCMPTTCALNLGATSVNKLFKITYFNTNLPIICFQCSKFLNGIKVLNSGLGWSPLSNGFLDNTV